MAKNKQNQRLSQKQKNKSNKQWYKDEADKLDSEYSIKNYGYGGVSEVKRMQVNYDLFNNILDLDDFAYVCKPFGSESGELPARMINRDITSGAIKALIGMEMKRPFSWKTVAINPEATTRREEEETKRIKEFVISQIMQPIKAQIEQKAMEEQQGKELTPEQQQEIQQKIAQETQAQTPDRVKKYMEREHQDPAEAMSSQLITYLLKKNKVYDKFNKMFKHGLLSAKELMYVGIVASEPCVWNVNPLRLKHDNSPDLEFIEDGEYAMYEYKMSPSDIMRYFSKELKPEDIDKIYEDSTRGYSYGGMASTEGGEDLFAEIDNEDNFDTDTISVLHCVWKSLRKIGFLTYIDEQGQEQMSIIDENYKLNKDFGDIKIEWEWIPEIYETWKIKTNDPIYVNMQPLPGQFKDLDNLYHSKLPYYGAIHDNMNSQPTAFMDRCKIYQYYYNILWYKFELLAATDKGKKVLMNINAIPDSAGIDIAKWQYFMESTPYMWYDPNEEGSTYNDANTVAKVIDLSYAGQMNQYIEMMEYVRQQLGRSTGVGDNVQGQIGPDEAVRNTQQSLIQSSHIIEPYFKVHEHVKSNIVQAILETAKVAYHNNPPKALSYVLGDMSVQTLKLDMGLLEGNTIGVFVANSGKAEEALNTIKQLSHAAMQNNKADLSDVISLIRQESIVEAEETLKAAEKEKLEQAQQAEQQRNASMEKMKQMEIQDKKDERQHEINMQEREYELKKELEITKGAFMGASFNADIDKDEDGINDFIEIAKHGLDAEIKQSKAQREKEKQELEREKFEHNKKIDNKKLKLEDKKMKASVADKKAKK